MEIVLCWTGVSRYTLEYVYAMDSMLAEFAPGMPINVICDRQSERYVPKHMKKIPSTFSTRSWWDKIDIYGPKMPETKLLYIDLDVVIVKSLLGWSQWETEGFVWAIPDALQWMGCQINSSFVILDGRCWVKVWEEFCENQTKIMQFPGGDQVWVSRFLGTDMKVLPGNPVVSYKFDLARGKDPIPEEACAVNFHGHPKPPRVRRAHEWIAKHWKEDE